MRRRDPTRPDARLDPAAGHRAAGRLSDAPPLAAQGDPPPPGGPDRGRRAGPPPDAVRRAAEALAPGAGRARWLRLRGGRTNRVWLVERAGGPPSSAPVVVKLCDGPATPLFPNDPEAEMAALRRLCGTGLAPRPIGAAASALGRVLVCEHVAAGGPAAPGAVARALARLHALAPPEGLRRLDPGPDGLHARLVAVARTLRGPLPAPVREALGAPPPDAPAPVRPAFLHGDPVPGNALAAPGGCVLIDWQCPALGDPCDDLAIALSPAMRRLDGLEPLTRAARAAALAAYGDRAVAARLARLAPLHRALIAAHCLWRAERGSAGAREAAALELGRA